MLNLTSKVIIRNAKKFYINKILQIIKSTNKNILRNIYNKKAFNDEILQINKEKNNEQ